GLHHQRLDRIQGSSRQRRRRQLSQVLQCSFYHQHRADSDWFGRHHPPNRHGHLWLDRWHSGSLRRRRPVGLHGLQPLQSRHESSQRRSDQHLRGARQSLLRP
ncbi:hypothetical protein FOZ63_015335, partial [Perkinsus olseni]